MDKLEYGRWGERMAHHFLMKKGYVILYRNWRFLKAEVDMIAYFEGRIVLVEVKSRWNNNFGRPASFVSNKQLHMICFAGEKFLEKHQFQNELQIDIIEIVGKPDSYSIEHFPGWR